MLSLRQKGGLRVDFTHLPLLDDELLLQIMKKCKTYSLPKVIGTCKRLGNIFNSRPKKFPMPTDWELTVCFTDFVDDNEYTSLNEDADEAYLCVDAEIPIDFANYEEFCKKHLKDTYFRKITIEATVDTEELVVNFVRFLGYLHTLNMRTVELSWEVNFGSISDGIKLFRPEVVSTDSDHEINRLIRTSPQLCRIINSNYASIKRLANVFPFITTHVKDILFWNIVHLVENLQKCRNEEFHLAVLDGFLDVENRDQLHGYFHDIAEYSQKTPFTQGRCFFMGAFKMKNSEKLLFIMMFYGPSKSVIKLFPAHSTSSMLSRSHPRICNEHFQCQKFKERIGRFAKNAFEPAAK